VTLHTVPLPTLCHPHALLVRVASCGTNPKDWKLPAGILQTIRPSSDPGFSDGMNSGDDVAGYVAAIGPRVTEFRVGDRVAGLHELGVEDGAAFAEYAVVMDWVAFHLGPDCAPPRPLPVLAPESDSAHAASVGGVGDFSAGGGIGFDEAATVPMACLMAVIGLFMMLRVTPGPWAPLEGHDADDEDNKADEGKQRPLVIYGAAGAVGAYAVQLAQLVNVHPVICVAGRGMEFVRSLLDEGKGDTVVDYRLGPDKVLQGIKDALKGRLLMDAFDATSENGSFINLSRVVAPGGHISLVLPAFRPEIPSFIRQSATMAGCLWKNMAVHAKSEKRTLGRLDAGQNGREFGLMYSRLVGLWLREGKLKPHPVVVVEGGLRGLEKALQDLRAGHASAVKYVVRIGETKEITEGEEELTIAWENTCLK